jgi:hypothetical protein
MHTYGKRGLYHLIFNDSILIFQCRIIYKPKDSCGGKERFTISLSNSILSTKQMIVASNFCYYLVDFI